MSSLLLLTHWWPSWGTAGCLVSGAQPAPSWKGRFLRPMGSERTPAPPLCTAVGYTRHTSASARLRRKSAHKYESGTITHMILDLNDASSHSSSCRPELQPGRWACPDAVNRWAVRHPVAGTHLACTLLWNAAGWRLPRRSLTLDSPYTLPKQKCLQGNEKKQNKIIYKSARNSKLDWNKCSLG